MKGQSFFPPFMYVKINGMWPQINWLGICQEQGLMNIIMNLHVSYKEGNFLTSCATIDFPRKSPPYSQYTRAYPKVSGLAAWSEN